MKKTNIEKYKDQRASETDKIVLNTLKKRKFVDSIKKLSIIIPDKSYGAVYKSIKRLNESGKIKIKEYLDREAGVKKKAIALDSAILSSRIKKSFRLETQKQERKSFSLNFEVQSARSYLEIIEILSEGSLSENELIKWLKVKTVEENRELKQRLTMLSKLGFLKMVKSSNQDKKELKLSESFKNRIKDLNDRFSSKLDYHEIDRLLLSEISDRMESTLEQVIERSMEIRAPNDPRLRTIKFEALQAIKATISSGLSKI